MSNCTFKMQPVNVKCTAISPSLLTYQYWYMNDKLVSVDNISSSNLSFSSGLFPSPLYLSVTFHFIVGAVVFFCFFWLLAFQIRLFNLLHDWVCLFCLVMQWVYLCICFGLSEISCLGNFINKRFSTQLGMWIIPLTCSRRNCCSLIHWKRGVTLVFKDIFDVLSCQRQEMLFSVALQFPANKNIHISKQLQ